MGTLSALTNVKKRTLAFKWPINIVNHKDPVDPDLGIANERYPELFTLKIKGRGLPVDRHLIPTEMSGPNSKSKGTVLHKTALISKLDTSLEVSRTISFQTSYKFIVPTDSCGFRNSLG